MSGQFGDGAAYVRGSFVPIAEANISVLDWGFTRSDCVYDVVHVFQGSSSGCDDHRRASPGRCGRAGWPRRRRSGGWQRSCTAAWR